jgi:multiple sugar transport system permease protein
VTDVSHPPRGRSTTPPRGRSTTASATSEPAGTPSAPAPGRRRRRSGWSLPYVLILPALVFELAIHIIPMLVGVYISFLRHTQLTIRQWTSAPLAGLRNYLVGLNPNGTIGSQLWGSLIRTVIFTVVVVGMSWGLGILGAVLLNSKFRGRGVLRTLFLVPYAMPVFVVVVGWGFMFNQRDGAVNSLLVDNLHLLHHRPFWLLGSNSFLVIMIIAIWKTWPFAFLMLLAALQNIPDELYEAASLDGASLWNQFRRITLPLIRPANVVVLLVMGLWTFNEFNTPYLLFGNAPPSQARLLSMHIYVNSFVNFNFGLGAAMSVLLLILLMIASILYLRVAGRRASNA